MWNHPIFLQKNVIWHQFLYRFFAMPPTNTREYSANHGTNFVSLTYESNVLWFIRKGDTRCFSNKHNQQIIKEFPSLLPSGNISLWIQPWDHNTSQLSKSLWFKLLNVVWLISKEENKYYQIARFTCFNIKTNCLISRKMILEISFVLDTIPA